MRLLICPLISMLISPVLSCHVQAADSPDGKSGEASATFRAYAKDVAAGYELTLGEPRANEAKLVAEPILRWSNPLGSQRARGEVFLWTHAGLPAALLSVNEFTDPAGQTHGEQEWCSLASGPLTAKGPHSWAPAAGVLAPRPLDGAPAPADTAPRRLRQLRDLAERFAGEKTTRAGVTRPLRLLPQPIYRYESKDADVLDGALFALVEATDLEVLLALEARRIGPTQAWHFALARMNSVRLAATCDGKQVWEGPALDGADVYNRNDKAYSAFLSK